MSIHNPNKSRPRRDDSAGSAPSTSTQVESPLLTTSEAAVYTRLSVGTLERLRSAGGGPAFIKLGAGSTSRVAYHIDDLRVWLGGHRRVRTFPREPLP